MSTPAVDASGPGSTPRSVAEGRWIAWAEPWRATLLLVLLVTAAKIAYLALWCPYTLVEDEAHYWEWSRRLDWSYYTKGPGIAVTIWATTGLGRLLGAELSEFWVRLGAPLASAVLMLSVAWMARTITGSGRAGFIAAAMVLLAPGFHLISLLITIDGPYAACWGVAAAAGWAALRRRSGWAWVLCGLAIGVGFTYKHAILLLPPGLALFALWQRGRLDLHARWPSWLAGGIAAASLGLAPVIIWNALNDWGTVRHLLGHLGLAGGDMAVKQGGERGWTYRPEWTLVLVVSQLGLMGPALILAIRGAWDGLREGPAMLEPPRLATAPQAGEVRVGTAYLVSCAAPMFLFYFGVSLLAEPEGNWPLAGHITLLPLAGIAAVAAVDALRVRRAAWVAQDPGRRARAGIFHRRPQTLMNCVWLAAVVIGTGAILLALRLDKVAQGPAARFVEARLQALGVVEEGRPMIPLGRIMHADVVARSAWSLAQQLRDRTALEPIIIAQQYGRASLLAFYMPGRPVVRCSSMLQGGRKTQYDLWPDTTLTDPALLGRPAVLVGGRLDQWQPAFETVESIGQLEGETKRGRETFIGLAFRGFPARLGEERQ